MLAPAARPPQDFAVTQPPRRNLAKAFTIGGFIVGELYMLYIVLAPNLHNAGLPWGDTVRRLLVYAIFFGPFGAAGGLGVGLLVQGALNLFRKIP